MASETDVQSLRAAGYEVVPTRPWNETTTLRKAAVCRDGSRVEIDWAADSAFRFFPIEPDPELGWRLHRFDAATNKALALSVGGCWPRFSGRRLVSVCSFSSRPSDRQSAILRAGMSAAACRKCRPSLLSEFIPSYCRMPLTSWKESLPDRGTGCSHVRQSH